MRRTKIIPVKWIHDQHDTDQDGVPNYRDCEPWNPHEHIRDPKDWMDTEKRKPRRKKEDTKIYIKGIPVSKKTIEGVGKGIDDYLKKEEGIVPMGRIFYKNYKIKFTKYLKGLEIGPYEGHPKTDIYLPNLVYATGFEQDPTSPYGEKYGKTIGTGKTKEEALRNAKRWIDK